MFKEITIQRSSFPAKHEHRNLSFQEIYTFKCNMVLSLVIWSAGDIGLADVHLAFFNVSF